MPETVKIDNLKAAVFEADFYEPVLQRTYAAFAAHYGFYAQPCRVYTPTDKGKVESNVKYVKDNCFKGRDFQDIEEARAFLSSWLDETANKRLHGTIKRVPAQLFEEVEKPKLMKLPQEDFIFSKTSRAIVNPNCHIAYGGNYYSVPYAYIGCEVDVINTSFIAPFRPSWASLMTSFTPLRPQLTKRCKKSVQKEPLSAIPNQSPVFLVPHFHSHLLQPPMPCFGQNSAYTINQPILLLAESTKIVSFWILTLFLNCSYIMI